jgi:hypothetical protein
MGRDSREENTWAFIMMRGWDAITNAYKTIYIPSACMNEQYWNLNDKYHDASAGNKYVINEWSSYDYFPYNT